MGGHARSGPTLVTPADTTVSIGTLQVIGKVACKLCLVLQSPLVFAGNCTAKPLTFAAVLRTMPRASVECGRRRSAAFSAAASVNVPVGAIGASQGVSFCLTDFRDTLIFNSYSGSSRWCHGIRDHEHWVDWAHVQFFRQLGAGSTKVEKSVAVQGRGYFSSVHTGKPPFLARNPTAQEFQFSNAVAVVPEFAPLMQ
jgi:hypothetical protein